MLKLSNQEMLTSSCILLYLIDESTIKANNHHASIIINKTNDEFLRLCYSLAITDIDSSTYKTTLEKNITNTYCNMSKKKMYMQMNALSFINKPNALVLASIVIFSYFNFFEKEIFLSTIQRELPGIYSKITFNDNFLYADIDGLINGLCNVWCFQ